jgi:hypothetical protein
MKLVSRTAYSNGTGLVADVIGNGCLEQVIAPRLLQQPKKRPKLT